MNDKKDPPKKALPGSKRKPPASLFLWLLAFLILASLIVFNSSPYFSAPEDWTANQFLSHLEKGEIVSAEILPESDKILAISGEFKNAPKAPAADTKKADASTNKADAEETKDEEKKAEEKTSAPEIVEKDLTKPSEPANAGKKTAPKLKLKLSESVFQSDIWGVFEGAIGRNAAERVREYTFRHRLKSAR